MLAVTPLNRPPHLLRLACRLEVGSESGQDHSKSIKSFLMLLLEGSGNTDVLVGPAPPWRCTGSSAALSSLCCRAQIV